MTADFLSQKPGLRRQLVTRYPVLLIDESQDTTKRLMDAFLLVQEAFSEQFCLGLLGDTMQRIYADGKIGAHSDVSAHLFRQHPPGCTGVSAHL